MNSLAPAPPAYVVRTAVRKHLQPRFFADWAQESRQTERYHWTPQERRECRPAPGEKRSGRRSSTSIYSRGYSRYQTRNL